MQSQTQEFAEAGKQRLQWRAMTDLKDSKMSDIKAQKEENAYCYAWFVAIIFIGLILVYLLVFIGRIMPEEKADLGVLGDYIGGVLNPIISFIALLFLIKTFTAQKEAFELQKEELELTREELKKSAEALEKQNETIELQRFETTFFNLLEKARVGCVSTENTDHFSNVQDWLRENLFQNLRYRSIEQYRFIAKQLENPWSATYYRHNNIKIETNPFQLIQSHMPFIKNYIFIFAFLESHVKSEKNRLDYKNIAINYAPNHMLFIIFLVYIQRKLSEQEKATKFINDIFDFANKNSLFSASEFDYHPTYFPLVDEAAWGDSLEEKRAAYLAYLQKQGITPNETHS